jgi:hypothetical protein
MSTFTRHVGLHFFCFLLLCECFANYITESLGHGNRLLVYSIRGALIAFVILYRHLTIQSHLRGTSLSARIMAGLLCCFVLWISVLGVCQVSTEEQVLFEPVRYWYWFSGFLFFYRYNMDRDAWRIVSLWAVPLFAVVTWQTVVAEDYNMSDSAGSVLAVNSSYMLLALYPWVWLSNRKLYTYVVTAIVAGCILAGVKRGAVVSFALMLVLSMFADYWTRGGSSRSRSLVRIALVLICCAAAATVAFQLRSDLIEKRFSTEAGLSNREIIYSDAYKQILESTPTEVILGRGPLSTLRENDWYAHNDWLQLVLDYGFAAGFLFLLIHLALMGVMIEHFRLRSPLCAPLACGYILFLVRGISGGYINYPEMMYFMCLVGGAVKANPLAKPNPVRQTHGYAFS